MVKTQKDGMDDITEVIRAATEKDENVLLSSDMNLDKNKYNEKKYAHKALAESFAARLENDNMCDAD